MFYFYEITEKPECLWFFNTSMWLAFWTGFLPVHYAKIILCSSFKFNGIFPKFMRKNHKIAAQNNPGRSHTFLPLFMWRIILFFLAHRLHCVLPAALHVRPPLVRVPGIPSPWLLTHQHDPTWHCLKLNAASSIHSGMALPRKDGEATEDSAKHENERTCNDSVGYECWIFFSSAEKPKLCWQTQENKKTFLIITSPHTKKELEHQKYAKNRFKW